MPQINTYSPLIQDKSTPLATRQRMLMAEALQDQAARTVTPAGKRGIAVGMAQLAAGLMSGVAQRQAAAEQDAGVRSAQDQMGRLAQGYRAPGAPAPGVPGAGGGPGRSPSSLGGAIQGAGSSANAATAYRYYLGKGLPEPSARALVGGFQQESGPGLNTGALNPRDGRDGSSSIGIGQWNSDRAAALHQFAAANGRDPGDLGTQLDFSWQELNGPEKASLNRLMAATDDHSATAAAVGYERPAGYRVDNPEAAVTFGKRLANTTALASLSGDPGMSRTPATPGGQLAATLGSTVTPAAMPNADPGMMAAADLPAPNAAPAGGQGLPGDMMQNPGAAPIPGSAYAPPADLGGGVVDANAPTSPATPAAIDPQQQALAAALMQGDPGSMGLTPANPNGAPGALLQPADMLNTMPDQGGPAPGLGMAMSAPQPKTMPASGGMNAALGVAAAQGQGDPSMMGAPMPSMGPQDGYGTNVATMAANMPPAGASPMASPRGAGAGPTDPDLQSLATALGAFGSVPTSAGTDTPKAFVPLPGQTQPSFQAGTFGTDVPGAVSRVSNDIGDMQAAGLPSFGGLPETNGKKVVLSNSPDFGPVPGAPAAPAPMLAANVPLPPQRPPQADLDALSQREAIATAHDPIATVSHMPGPADMPAPNAQPAMAAGLPGDMTAGGPGGGFSPIGKQATYQTPQAFNLAQSGNAGLASALMNYQPGQAPAAPSMSPAQRGALATALQNQGGAASGGTGQGSAFGQVMNGGDIGGVARQQFANLGGNTDGGLSGSDRTALANGLSPGIVPAPAGAPPAASPAQAGGWQADAVALASNPYASAEQRAYAIKLLEQSSQTPKPVDWQHIERPDGSVVAFNPQTQEMRQISGPMAKPLDPTGEQRDYQTVVEQAKAAGQPVPSFADYQQGLRRSGASTVSVDTKAENAEAQGRGQGVAKRFNELAEAGTTAQGDALVIDRLGDLLGNVQTGPKTAALERLRQMTGGAVSLDPNASNVQALNAAVSYLAPRLRVPGAGTTSDRDLATFMQSIPNLAGTPDGNAKVLDTLRGMASQKQAAGRIAQQWQLGQISAADAQRQLDALPSPFAPQAGAGAGGGAQGPAGPAADPRVVGGSAITGNPPAMPQAQQQAAQQATPADALNQARAAIAAGKSRAAVIQRLRSLNIDPTGL